MKLAELLEKTEYEVRQGSTDQEVKGLAYDSRKVSEGFAFACISGSMQDGHDFIPEVVKKGAKVLVVQKEVEAPGRCYGHPGKKYPSGACAHVGCLV